MNIKPVGNRLIVLPLPRKEESLDNGLVLPESANADLAIGKVVEVPNSLNELYKENDIVLFPSKSGVGQMYNGKPHLWINAETEIWGIISE